MSLREIGDELVRTPGSDGRLVVDGGSIWKWHAGNISHKISADEVTPGEGDGGLWKAPLVDKTGASGGFQRMYDGPVYANWYGADRYAQDNGPALRAWIKSSKLLAMQPGVTYRFTGGLGRIYGNTILHGNGSVLWQIGTVNEDPFEDIAMDLIAAGECNLGDFTLRHDCRVGIAFRNRNKDLSVIGNCLRNTVRDCAVVGPGRSASRPDVSGMDHQAKYRALGCNYWLQGEDQALGGQAVTYFNKLVNVSSRRCDIGVLIDGGYVVDYGYQFGGQYNPSSGANASEVHDFYMDQYWYGIYIDCVENHCVGGFFNQSGGADGVATVGYYLDHNASLCKIKAAPGEPGNPGRCYEAAERSSANVIELPQHGNYSHGNIDLGSNTSLDPTEYPRVVNLIGFQEGKYYRLPLGYYGNGIPWHTELEWASVNGSHTLSGRFRFTAKVRGEVWSIQIIENTQYPGAEGTYHVYPAGIDVVENYPYLVFYCVDNGGQNANARIFSTMTGRFARTQSFTIEEVTDLGYSGPQYV